MSTVHPGFTLNMALNILENERYDERFEDFCSELFSDEDQITYVRTSSSHDLGKDAKGVPYKAGKVPPLICCSVDKRDIVAKAVLDTKRILERTEPSHLTYCFTVPSLSETRAQTVEDSVRKLSDSIETVRVFGARHIAEIALKHPRPFEKFYSAELQDLRSALSAQVSGEIELTGLRLALTTQLHDDAQSRRSDLVRNLILTALADGQPHSLAALAKDVSDKLRLPRIVQPGWLQSELDDLTEHDLLVLDGLLYRITPAGRLELESRTQQGSVSLLEGQQKIAQAIEELTGTAPSRIEFRQVWNVLSEGLTAMFLAHGAIMAESIGAILGGESTLQEECDLRSHIERMGRRVEGLPGEGDRIREVAQAVIDMFAERSSPAFEWLAEIADVFLHLCALGLEPASQTQIIQHLRDIDLILDTDVVLSLLSEGEANHASVRLMLTGWPQVGGTLYVSDPVLEEAAHHAWMSEGDFQRNYGSMNHENFQAHLTCSNVFVRGFVATCRGMKEKCTPRLWQQYVGAFKGTHDLDYDKIVELLEDLKCVHLRDTGAESEVAHKIADELVEARRSASANAAAINDLREKSKRDGRLLAVLLCHRRAIRPDRRTAYIVSGGLRQGAQSLEHITGEREAAIYAGAVAWLLSLVPGVKLNATTLRKVLFEADVRIRVDALERALFRYLQASEQYKLNLSRRSTLKRAVREQINKRAAQFGVPARDIEDKLIQGKPEDAELAASIVGPAIDQIAFSQLEQQFGVLKEENRRLKEKLDKAERSSNQGAQRKLPRSRG